MDVEAAEAIHALEFFEAVQRHFACAGDKLEELSAFLLVKRADGAPEPLDLWRRGRIIVVLSVVLPVVNVNIRQPGNEKLKLLFIEDGDEFCRNNVVETWIR